MNDLIAVAMSGGVDSSTVAALLKRDGHNIAGLTMQLWNQRRLPELATEAIDRALLLARRCLRCPARGRARRHAVLRGESGAPVRRERGRAVRRTIISPGARRCHARSATRSSSSTGFWIWPIRWAPRPSPPGTMRASRGIRKRDATKCARPSILSRTRPISSGD